MANIRSSFCSQSSWRASYNGDFATEILRRRISPYRVNIKCELLIVDGSPAKRSFNHERTTGRLEAGSIGFQAKPKRGEKNSTWLQKHYGK